MCDQTSLDAAAYAELLIGRTEGYPFHSPKNEGVIGDCGVIREGQFVFLFNCFVDGIGGERLSTSEPNPGRIPVASDLEAYPIALDRSERSVILRSNQDVVWRVHKGRHWSVDLEVPISLPPVEVGFGFQASRASGKAAFLIPGNARRRVEKYLEDKVFTSYLARHHNDIHARFGARYSTRTVYMIEGTTHASSWCRGVATRHTSDIKGFVAVNPMLPGIPGFRVGGSTGQSIEHPWSIEPGPALQPPTGELHLISARLVVKQSRLPDALRSTPSVTALIHGAATPSPDGQGLRPPSERHSHSQGGATGNSLAGRSASSSGTAYQTDIPGFVAPEFSENSRNNNRPGVQTGLQYRGSPCVDTFATGGLSDVIPMDDASSPPNFIETLLDACLAAHPYLDAIVASWTVLEAFWAELENGVRYDAEGLIFIVKEIEGGVDGRVAEICRISPPVLISELVEGCIAAHPDSAQVPLAARCGNRTSLRAVPKDIIEEDNEYKTVLGQLLESGTLNTRL